MAARDIFSNDGKFFGEMSVPLSTENFERYKLKYGQEKAEGYLEAIRDMKNALTRVCEYGRAGDKQIRTWAGQLYGHTFYFLKNIDDINSKSSNDAKLCNPCERSSPFFFGA